MTHGMPTGISLFSGGGIGDLAMRAAGIQLLVANELLEDRSQVVAENFPEAQVVSGDIAEKKQEIIDRTRKLLQGSALDVVFATPPCQGMSKNGRGKLLNGVRKGVKPTLDPRNQLVLHAVEIINALKPELVVFENVPEMENTLITARDGSIRGMLDVVRDELGPDYAGRWEVVEFADYGVPQRRQRLITVFGRSQSVRDAVCRGHSLLPARTHAQSPSLFQRPWITVDEALQGVRPLDARDPTTARSSIPFHVVPVLDERKYFWVSNTPPGKGAFDNQCVNPACRFQANPTHGSQHNSLGINRSRTDTPIHCVRCGALLPRPSVEQHGQPRLMAGFTSAYKRMRGDMPASALTRNLSYACSDQKLHPRENRVLSLFEAFRLHTVSDFDFTWRRADGKKLSDKTIREIIGESIPPRGLQKIFAHLCSLYLTTVAVKAPREGGRQRLPRKAPLVA
ncbi:MAG: DNA cytosine methyltransferase [Deltaproteobacteria bacterium]|nr:DNA cytosine methyltransferase [Deltaproteobacteria bacterium]